jgi:hypothetical protein
MSGHQNLGQNLYVKMANRSFGNVAKFKYFEMTGEFWRLLVTVRLVKLFIIVYCKK